MTVYVCDFIDAQCGTSLWLDAELGAKMRNVTIIKRTLWGALFIFSAYVLLTDYDDYRNSIRVTGTVSAIRYVSTIARKMDGDCLSRRDTCAGLYSYDITYWQGEKSYIFHATRELKSPSNAMCVQYVQNDPRIAKLCHHLFFNTSLKPYLIALWSIVAFMSLTLLLYYKRYPNLPVLMTWRIINRRHQLLLETEDREEALRFINRGYRICTTEQWQKVIRVGGKKVINECTVYFVRGGGRSKGNVE